MDGVAHFLVADDAAGDEAGDLGEDDFAVGAFDGDEVLLIIGGGFRFAGDEEFAGFVFDIGDFTGDGRAVDVDVEDVEEDADAGLGTIGFDGDDNAVGGGDGNGAFRDLAIRVTEEPEAEDGEDEEGDAVSRLREVAGKGGADEEAERVVDAVDDHVCALGA